MSTANLTDPKASFANGDVLYEVIHGHRVEMPPMSIYASLLSTRLGSRLNIYADDHQLGTAVTEGLFVLDPEHDIRKRPDVAFVSAQSWPLDRPIPETGDWAIVPDLAVEVVSPTETFEEVLAKLDEYFSYGIKLAWVVVPNETKVYVYQSPTAVTVLSLSDALDGGDLIPGFRLPLADLFKRPAPVGP